MLTQRVLRKRTKEVEVLDELVLGASLVGGTKDVNEQTTGQEAGEDAIRVDLRLAQAASGRATTTLGLGLVDGRGAAGGNAEGEGENGTVDSGELHCDWF